MANEIFSDVFEQKTSLPILSRVRSLDLGLPYCCQEVAARRMAAVETMAAIAQERLVLRARNHGNFHSQNLSLKRLLQLLPFAMIDEETGLVEAKIVHSLRHHYLFFEESLLGCFRPVVFDLVLLESKLYSRSETILDMKSVYICKIISGVKHS